MYYYYHLYDSRSIYRNKLIHTKDFCYVFNRRVGVCIIIFNYKHRSHLEIATVQR